MALVGDGAGEQVATRLTLQVALVRCCRCGGRFRELPMDVLPHKHYGLAASDAQAAAHFKKNASLRPAAWSTHIGRTSARSTLHAMTEGLCAFVLDRRFPPVSAWGGDDGAADAVLLTPAADCCPAPWVVPVADGRFRLHNTRSMPMASCWGTSPRQR